MQNKNKLHKLSFEGIIRLLNEVENTTTQHGMLTIRDLISRGQGDSTLLILRNCLGMTFNPGDDILVTYTEKTPQFKHEVTTEVIFRVKEHHGCGVFVKLVHYSTGPVLSQITP